MDLVSVCMCVCAVMVCAFKPARCSNCECPFSALPPVPLTKPPQDVCLNNTFRYTCVDGYVRKAGTSNLAKCREHNGAMRWIKPSLQCIPDPLRTTTRSPESSVKYGRTNISPDITITTTTTAFLVSHEKTQYESISVSATTETYNASLAWSEFVTTTAASNNSTHNSHVLSHSDLKIVKTTAAVIVCVSLVIICAVIGISYVCYRRRSRHNDALAREEMVSMNPVSSDLAL